MHVEALDHVNIITADLEGTVSFYAQLFGLEPRDGPPPLTHENARWMYDASGRAIVHINALECPRAYDREVHAGPTGALHHVALRAFSMRWPDSDDLELGPALHSTPLRMNVSVKTALGVNGH